jgi:4-hydroxybutyryl-CoA dehydratase / vinylacetyl-CoA-Delta-isomerase
MAARMWNSCLLSPHEKAHGAPCQAGAVSDALDPSLRCRNIGDCIAQAARKDIAAMLMTTADYRESLRALSPRVFVNGRRIESVPDEPVLAPGIAATGVLYDLAHVAEHKPLMTAVQRTSGKTVNRMLHVGESSQDLLYKLEAIRLACRVSGCAMRYLSHDGINAIFQATSACDDDKGTDYHQRFAAYLHAMQDKDFTLGVAMTDAKGDRSKRPHLQDNPNAYVHIKERRKDGIVISGTKAIITGAPYVHELLVMPCRTMAKEDADFAVCCAVPLDAPGITIAARPAGRPASSQGGANGAKYSAKYGQSTGAAIFEDVFVPWDRVFMAGEWEHSGLLTTNYATHHRHSCIGARAGFGDLLIGAGVLMTQANGLDFESHGHLRDSMVELITIVEGFFACGVAASVYGAKDISGTIMPDAVFANVGKLLLATQIYDMHRLAHTVSGGLVVALPGPDEDHNPHTGAKLADVLRASPSVSSAQRLEVARLLEDVTASYAGGWMSLISLHGGGSPEAMKREIWRNYPIAEKTALVEGLLDRGVTSGTARPSDSQPGRCCATGCEIPAPARAAGVTGVKSAPKPKKAAPRGRKPKSEAAE